MAITWGPFESSGGNAMRVGIEVTWENISHGENAATATIRIYTENQFNYSDNQTLNYSGNIGGSHSYFNGGSSGSSAHRDTKSDTYNYGSNEYGSSPGSRTYTAEVTGAYNGITPQVTVNSSIPARPAAAPDTPHQEQPSQIDGNSVRVNYSLGFDGGANVDHVQIQRAFSSGFGPNTETYQDGSGFTWYDGITDLSPNTQYYTRCRAHNSVGYSGWSNTRSFTTDVGTPSAPTNVSVSDIAPTSVTVSWSAPSDDGGSSIEDYRIQVATDSGFNNLVYNVATGSTSTTHDVPGLTPGTQYWVQVRAWNGSNSSDYSSAETFETLSGAKVRVGGQWIDAVPKVRVGGAWEIVTPKVRDGGVWV